MEDTLEKEMIEPLAKAAFESFYAGSDLGWKWEGELEKTKEHWRMVIRAVLKRMKNPIPRIMDEAPSRAGLKGVGSFTARLVLQTMIDAALQEDRP